MALDPRIETVRQKYGLAADDFWQLPQNKQWVCKHAALEVVAVKAGIRFDMPQIIEARGGEGVAAVCVQGQMGERVEWSIGECSPKNNRNSYPWAMAEKRAKDRVILKLSGIHGLVYSDNEMDGSDAASTASAPMGKISAYRAKQLLKADVLLSEIDTYKTERGLKDLEAELRSGALSFLPDNWVRGFQERIDARRQELNGDGETERAPTPSETLDRQYAETMRE